MGQRYANGKGVTKDDAQAAAWYRKAAEQGHAPAQFNLGLMYANGTGVAKDDAQAVSWYRKAAEQGFATAQLNLGAMYANGTGVAKDDEQAVSWFRKAAEQGDATAQNNLGVMYANGRGLARDYAQAAAWYRKAAEQGHLAAQNKINNLPLEQMEKHKEPLPMKPLPNLQKAETRYSKQNEEAKTVTKVVGVTHNNSDGSCRQEIISRLSHLSHIRLVRDPGNAFDSNAIAVHADSVGQLGFLAKELAATLAPIIDAGNPIRASIVALTGGDNGYSRGVTIEINVSPNTP